MRISDLQNLMNSTSLGDWERDLPNLNKSESGSSYRWSVSPVGESMPQVEAADFTQAETSLTDGREAQSAFQQSSSSLQTLSERPSSIAFSGFRGFFPPKTLKITSEPPSLPYGNDPVRTYSARISTCAFVGHRATRTWYIVIAIAYTSAPFVGAHLSNPNLDGTRSSGAMKVVVPPATADLGDTISRSGLCTMVMNPKSARHAKTGVVFVIRMLAWTIA